MAISLLISRAAGLFTPIFVNIGVIVAIIIVWITHKPNSVTIVNSRNCFFRFLDVDLKVYFLLAKKENKNATKVDIKLANSFGTLKSIVKIKSMLKSSAVLTPPTIVKRSLSACFFCDFLHDIPQLNITVDF